MTDQQLDDKEIQAVPKILDLNGFSKRELTEDIVRNLPQLTPLLEVNEADLAEADELDIRIFGLEEYGLFEEREFKALLCKHIPRHLLTQKQHIKGVSFEDKVMVPELDEENHLLEKEHPVYDQTNQDIRTLCIKKHSEPLLRVFSASGLSTDSRVLKIIILNAVIHDFGHGVIDYYFDLFESLDEDDDWEPLHEWIIQLGCTFGYGTPMTPKSAAYLVDNNAADNSETPDEKAQIGIERAQEDFSEAFRLRCLNQKEYDEAMRKKGNAEKRDFIERLWDGLQVP